MTNLVRLVPLAPVVLLAACGPDFDFDFSSHNGMPYVTTWSDGKTLLFAACPGQGFLGCGQPVAGEVVTIETDGLRREVPIQDLDLFLYEQFITRGLFTGHSNQLALVPPVDDRVEAEVFGTATTLQLAPDFAISTPAPVVRGEAPIVVTFAAYPSADEPQVLMDTHCEVGSHDWNNVDLSVAAGCVTIAYDSEDRYYGTCLHEIRIMQRVPTSTLFPEGDVPFDGRSYRIRVVYATTTQGLCGGRPCPRTTSEVIER